ncbi:hypothetical protein [Azorhizobium doebereinerae]|uniref:DUF4376 domain-containing protein n=1 Tax=Azorhizobium doebereinerae TaxID=281091 RepID=UPI000554FBCB|nr:hypothetical protein [Azorhizobium doebereinerae]
MMGYVRIQGGVVVELIPASDLPISDRYHAEYVATLTPLDGPPPQIGSTALQAEDGGWSFGAPERLATDLLAAKVAELDAACAATILGGFRSSALGSLHAYPSNETDQINLMGSVTASLLPGLADGWTTPFWCRDMAGAWAFRDHDAVQIQAVGADGKAHVVACQTLLAALAEEAASASDDTALAAIVWPEVA